MSIQKDYLKIILNYMSMNEWHTNHAVQTEMQMIFNSVLFFPSAPIKIYVK